MFKQNDLFNKICLFKYFVLLFLTNSYICVNKGMEESVHNVSENETVELVDGSLSVKRCLLEKCSVIKDLLAVPGEGLELKTADSYTKDNFELLLRCLENYKTIHAITSGSIVDIINLAGNLGAPVKLRKKLTKRALNLDIQIAIDKEIGINTLESINRSNTICGSKLILSHKKLVNLQGIQDFENQDIAEIDLSHNNLRSLDISQLLKLFPNLKKLDIRFNKLTNLTVGSLPKYFTLRASNNKLIDLVSFKVDESCQLDLCDNQFSPQIKQKIERFVKNRSVMQHAKVLYRYYTSACLIWYLLIAGPLPASLAGGIGAIAGGVVDVARCYVQAKNYQDLHLPLSLCGLFIGAAAGALLHPVVVINEYYDCYKSEENPPCSFGYNGHVMCSFYKKSHVDFNTRYRSEYRYE